MAEEKQIYSEVEEAFENLSIDVRLTKLMLALFGLIALFAKIFLEIPISIYVFFIMFFWFLCYSVYPLILKKKKTASGLYSLYFNYISLDLVFITVIIHYLGSAEWIGVIFYLVTITFAGTILPKKKSLLLSFLATLFYSILVFLEYFQILPHRPLFALRPGIYQNLGYVLSQLLLVAAFFFFIGETSGTFSNRIKEKHSLLIKERGKTSRALKEAEEARKILEVRVQARTKELQKLTQEQEEVIEARTKELQKKIAELERFQKLTVGRELKMVELKRELKGLKEKLKEGDISKKDN